MTFVVTLIALYLAVGLLAWVFQRQLLFPAPTDARQPDARGGSLLSIPTSDGTKIYAVHFAARESAPTLVYFHGNAEQLADSVHLARMLHKLGLGVLAVEYPGYGLAARQQVSEQAIYLAAETAIQYLIGTLKVPKERIVLLGQSLGTGVAAEMAARGHGVRMILISPFTSVPDMAQRTLFFLPARWLVRDRFDTWSKAARIQIPVLIIHGYRDEVIPVSMGRRLTRRFPHGEYHEIPRAGHNDVFSHDVESLLQRMQSFASGGKRH